MNKREMAAYYQARADELLAEADREEQELADARAAVEAKQTETTVYEQAFRVLHDGVKPIANSDNPYPIQYGQPVIPNMHYLLAGHHYVCMPANDNSDRPVILTEDNQDDVMYLAEEESE